MKAKLTLVLALLLTIFSGVSAFNGPLAAAATFSPNHIMDDGVFDNSNSMTVAQINAFFNGFSSSCLSPNNGFTAPDPTGYTPTGGFTYGSPVSAGQVLSDAAQSYGLNPQVLLATLQKEQSLVDGSAGCSASRVAKAVGYGCPDSGGSYSYSYGSGGNLLTPIYYSHGTPINAPSGTICVNSAAKVGFSEQIIHAAWLLKFGEQRSEGNVRWAVIKGSWDNSDDPQSCYSGPMTQGTFARCPSGGAAFYDGYTTIDGTAVHMDTGSTAALYWYTPHFAGNQNFSNLFTSWFGSPYFTVNISYSGADTAVDNRGDIAVVPVVLSGPPVSTIQLNYGVSNPSLAKIVGRNALIFTPSNWNVPQNIVVQGLSGSASSQNFNLQVLFINSPDGAFSQSITPFLAQLPMFWSNTNESAIYRLYNSSTGKHAYAVSASVLSSLQSNGYSLESTVGYQCIGSTTALDVENSIGLVRPLGNADIPSPATSTPTILFSNDGGDISVTILKNPTIGDTVLSSSSPEINSLEQNGYTVVATVQLCNQGDVPVYRLYDPTGNTHFYTSSAAEADNTLGLGFGFEGVAFYNNPSDTTPVYRLYDPTGNTHFYTSSAAESGAVQRIGFRYEGIGWYAGNSSTPVYRLYDPTGNTHFYTSSAAESGAVQRIGFRYEGIGWYAK